MPESGPLTLEELDRLLKGVSPTAVLVPPRLLRRIIKHDRQLPGLGLQVPHRKTYVCTRARLLAQLLPGELDLPAGTDPAAPVLLIVRPEPGALAELSRPVALLKFWRLLFHTRVHQVLEPVVAALTASELQQRIDRIGVAEFGEARSVLRQEHFLLPPGDDRATYIEFAAVYLDLRRFSPALLSEYFPGITHPEAVDAVFAADIDAGATMAGTRPQGAPDPDIRGAAVEPDAADLPPAATPNGVSYTGPKWLAETAATKGNLVRAARIRMQAGDHNAAEGFIRRLAQRLQSALDFTPTEGETWARLLLALLPSAARGMWPASARLLYDIQKVCLDYERPVFKLDLVEWGLTLGRRSFKRPLPGHADLKALRHLQRALDRLPRVALTAPDRRELAKLLQAAVRQRQHLLRERFRPILLHALEEVGLCPANLPERVARTKLVEELLDRIADHGSINLGDLRDALSRNQLKLPDLKGLGEFWHGDPLLRLDQRLHLEMEGAYRKGETYMRWLQRFSSLAFGTPAGRFLTRFVALPFGLAFLIIEGLKHAIEPIIGLLGHPTLSTNALHAVDRVSEVGLLGAPGSPAPLLAVTTQVAIRAAAGWHWDKVLWEITPFVLLGFFMMGVLHVPAFRARVLDALWMPVRLIGTLLRLSARLLLLRWLRRLLANRWVRWLWYYLVKPAGVAVGSAFLGLAALPELWPSFLGDLPKPGPWAWVGVSLVLFPPALVILNSRWLRGFQDRFADHLERTWGRLFGGFLPGLVSAILAFFRTALEGLDRFIYAVDEQLRFRTGDSIVWMYGKLILGLFWFVIAYVVRFCVNLLIEPQLNPIKHFPVVTVSHKIVLTMGVPPLGRLLHWGVGLPLGRAFALATFISGLIPGIFGFLVWELQGNWKLYRSNRSTALQPTAVGSHGETLARLLRPGFHSGTLPKLFSRLRRSGRRGRVGGNWARFRKQRDALHHVQQAVHQFIQRELLGLLRECKSWDGLPIEIGAVLLSINCIRVSLSSTAWDGDPVRLAFWDDGGHMWAWLERTGWLVHLKPDQRTAFAIALAGVYKLGSVDELKEGVVPREKFRDVQISWQAWVETWEAEQAGRGLEARWLAGVTLLPEPPPEPAAAPALTAG